MQVCTSAHALAQFLAEYVRTADYTCSVCDAAVRVQELGRYRTGRHPGQDGGWHVSRLRGHAAPDAGCHKRQRVAAANGCWLTSCSSRGCAGPRRGGMVSHGLGAALPLPGMTLSLQGMDHPFPGITRPFLGMTRPLLGGERPLLGMDRPLRGVNRRRQGGSHPRRGGRRRRCGTAGTVARRGRWGYCHHACFTIIGS